MSIAHTRSMSWHQDIIARRVLGGYSPAHGNWPTQFLPDLTAAHERYAQPEPALQS